MGTERMLLGMKQASNFQTVKSLGALRPNFFHLNHGFHAPTHPPKLFPVYRSHNIAATSSDNSSTLRRAFSSRFSHLKNSKNIWKNSWILLPLAMAAGQEAFAEVNDEIEAVDGTVVFTTSWCPYCRKAKELLGSLNIQYAEFDVGDRPDLGLVLSEGTGRFTVPVVFVKGTYVGGFDELNQAHQNGALKKLLSQERQALPPKLISAIGARDSIVSPKPEGSVADAQTDRQNIRRLRLEQISSLMADSDHPIQKTTLQNGWKSQKNVFSGSTAVKWFLDNLPDIESAEEALKLGKELQKERLLHHAEFSEEFSGNDGIYFRLHVDEPSFSSALNAKTVWLKPSRSATQVAEDLRRKVTNLYAEALSKDGKSVNYRSLFDSEAFKAYVEASQELQQVSLYSLSREEAMAFWINIYNALVIHAVIVSLQAGKSNLSFFDRLSFYSNNSYVISNLTFSLDDIEHGVLRGNKPKPSNLLKNPSFGPSDPRRFYSLAPVDPRIHFSLNCGAKSCPPIKVFNGKDLDYGLRTATIAFCESEVEIDDSSRTIVLSKLWDWYGSDFGKSKTEILRWIAPFLDESKRRKLESLVESGDFKVVFKKYDWGLND